MNRNVLRGGLIAVFPILVCVATQCIVSATRGAPPYCVIALSLLILTLAIRMGGQKQASLALAPRELRELRRQRRSR